MQALRNDLFFNNRTNLDLKQPNTTNVTSRNVRDGAEERSSGRNVPRNIPRNVLRTDGHESVRSSRNIEDGGSGDNEGTRDAITDSSSSTYKNKNKNTSCSRSEKDDASNRGSSDSTYADESSALHIPPHKRTPHTAVTDRTYRGSGYFPESLRTCGKCGRDNDVRACVRAYACISVCVCVFTRVYLCVLTRLLHNNFGEHEMQLFACEKIIDFVYFSHSHHFMCVRCEWAL